MHRYFLQCAGYTGQLTIVCIRFQKESLEDGEGGENEDKAKKRNKVKYHCECGTNVWGKSGLHIHCPVCAKDFEEE